MDWMAGGTDFDLVKFDWQRSAASRPAALQPAHHRSRAVQSLHWCSY